MASTLIRRAPGTTLYPLIFKSSSKTSRLQLKPHSFCVKDFEQPHNISVYHVSASRHLFISASLRAAAASTTPPKSSISSSSLTTAAIEKKLPHEDTKNDDTVHRERYIPITRESIIRLLVQEKDFLTEEEKKLFPDFVQSLDSVLVNKYHIVLEELKTLFDPINPDKDTLKSREWTRKEKLDYEFWLLQKLEGVMAKANFHELPRKKVDRFLKGHEAQERVRVSVDPSRYDVLRFWVLGHDIPELKVSLTDRILNAVLRRPPIKPKEYFKRVVVALRLKKDSKLILKAFKEVPVQSLEMLLPDGTVRMRAIDRGLLVTSAAIAGFGVLAKVVTILASLQVDWTLVVTLVTGAVGFRVWSAYRNRRNAYLVDVSRTLYFKNIANNWGLLTLLVDRAEDESLKEALLTYVFLLKSSATRKGQGLFTKSQTDGLTGEELEAAVEKWLEQTTGVKIEFDSSEALKLLQTLGLLNEKDKKYDVLQLDVAARLLPQSLQSVIAQRATKADIAGGFSKDEYLETEEEYRLEDRRTRKYGWF